jgi:hypothetical protein
LSQRNELGTTLPTFNWYFYQYSLVVEGDSLNFISDCWTPLGVLMEGLGQPAPSRQILGGGEMRAKRSGKFGNSSRRAAKLKHKKNFPRGRKRVETWSAPVSLEPKEMAGYLPGLYLG